jgi:hypothetical protein
LVHLAVKTGFFLLALLGEGFLGIATLDDFRRRLQRLAFSLPNLHQMQMVARRDFASLS